MPVIPEYGKQWNKFQGQHYLYYTRLERKRTNNEKREREEREGKSGYGQPHLQNY